MSIIEALSPFGFYGVLVGVLLWMIVRLQDRTISVVEKNTKAFIELKDAIHQNLLRRE